MSKPTVSAEGGAMLAEGHKTRREALLLVHVMGGEWRGAASELEWDIDQARTLLGEFAGMSAEDLGNV